MKVKEMTFADALTALREADKVLHAAKPGKDLREAAQAYATAERTARSAKNRESNVGSLLEAPAVQPKPFPGKVK